ncbi:MAG: nitrite/sulfite reductase, partial [Dehalococcoidia bacterium]|nr:nitrite/sulfite reductase [Dehalococcoidia bacterium]
MAGKQLDPIVTAEIDNFEKEAKAFSAGGGLGDDFRPFRLQHGIYGQRQDEAQMIRVKIPHGTATADQMDVLGDVAEQYTPRKVGHVTTRQDIQYHFVKLEDVAAVMRVLAEADLTTREACGNTVRNVTADHMSGLCSDTVFDVTPYAEATARFFLRHPVCQKLPRKFKIAFSACPHDHGLVPIHDLGATAVMRDGQRGFRVTVGGGLGAAPFIAQVLEEFVPENELQRVTEATLRVFDRLGERKNRNKARIKFVLKKLGIEELRRTVQEELATLPPAENG